jgi:hypothetical protein
MGNHEALNGMGALKGEAQGHSLLGLIPASYRLPSSPG